MIDKCPESMDHLCPQCGASMVHQQEEADVGVAGLWYCEMCDVPDMTIDDFDDYADDHELDRQ